MEEPENDIFCVTIPLLFAILETSRKIIRGSLKKPYELISALYTINVNAVLL